jgi:hypothetical protein
MVTAHAKNQTQMDCIASCFLMFQAPSVTAVQVTTIKATWKQQLKMEAETKKLNGVMKLNGLSKMSPVYI